MAGATEMLSGSLSLVDLTNLGVAIQPLHFEASDIARSPEHLDRIAGLGDDHVAGKTFGDRAGGVRGLAIVNHHGGPMHERAGGGDVFGHVGQHPLQALKRRKGLSELLARLRIVQRSLQSGLRDAHRQRADADAAFSSALIIM